MDITVVILAAVIFMASFMALGIFKSYEANQVYLNQIKHECSDIGGVNIYGERGGIQCFNVETGTRIIVPSEIVK